MINLIELNEGSLPLGYIIWRKFNPLLHTKIMNILFMATANQIFMSLCIYREE